MEDEKLELKFLKEGISYLEKAMKNFVCCDSVSDSEYGELSDFLETLTDKKIDLEVKIENLKEV